MDIGPTGEIAAAYRTHDGLRIAGPQWSLPAPAHIRFPMVRFLTSDRVVLVDSRTPGESNAWILDTQRGLISTFFADDAVQHVIVVGDAIVCTYFDEAFGSSGPAGEGVALFDHVGQFLWGYQSHFGAEAVDTFDVYAACPDGSDFIWFFSYTDFELVRLNIRTREQSVMDVPEALCGSHAISIHGETAYFMGPYEDQAAIFEWSIGTRFARKLLECEGLCRGLAGGRFLHSSDHGWSVLERSVTH